MADNQWENYYSVLNRIENNMTSMDSNLVEKLLDELYQIKPVRLKWYLVKAQFMLKENNAIDEIVDFLSDKCEPWYDYEDVRTWFYLLSALAELKGDIVESKRYIYQFNKMQEVRYDAQGNNGEIDSEIAALSMKIIDEKNWQKQNLLALGELYYIAGNIYLYLLLMVVLNQKFEEEMKIRDWVLQKINVGYYYERLLDDRCKEFVIMETESNQADCLVARQALEFLGKRVSLLKVLDTDEVSADIGMLNYIAAKQSEDDVVMVLGSGNLIDLLAMQQEAKPRFERLTPAEADYMEENMAVARFGDYLAYIAPIYMVSRQEIERALYQKPTCRFSIIIPCRNAGETLYYTLKTCLEQEFDGEYEIVVSDNSDMSWGTDTPTYRICQDFHDDKIKYYRTPRNLSLMKNFEYAYLKAQGEFLISMGADDGILPWALKELDGIMNEFPDQYIWLWHEAFYKWADVDKSVMENAGKATLRDGNGYIKGSPNIYQYKTREIFLDSFTYYGNMYYLPQIYHNSGIRRKYLVNLYKKTGVLWGGKSQDICMAVTIGNIEEMLPFIENTLTITGISNDSIGANVRVGKNMFKHPKTVLTQGNRALGYVERLMPPMGVDLSGLYGCILYAHGIGVISDDFIEEMDWKGMYERVTKALSPVDPLYEKKIHRLRYAASLHGTEMLEWFDHEIYNQSMESNIIKESSTLPKEEEYQEIIVIQGEVVQAPPHSIDDVYKVSRFLKHMYDGTDNYMGEET